MQLLERRPVDDRRGHPRSLLGCCFGLVAAAFGLAYKENIFLAFTKNTKSPHHPKLKINLNPKLKNSGCDY